MAKGRFLSRDISTDEKVESLSCDSARLLFTWLIPHLDCEGRFFGEPQVIKNLVAPRRNWQTRKVKNYLIEMQKVGLVVLYSVGNNQYLFCPNFEKHQSGLRKDRESPSRIPAFTPDLVGSNDGVTPDLLPHKSKVKSKSKSKSKLKGDADAVTTVFSKNITNWKATEDDAEWFASLFKESGLSSKEFREEMTACVDYYDGKPVPKDKGAWKNRFRNWIKKGKQINGKPKKGERKKLPDDTDLDAQEQRLLKNGT